MSINSRFSIFSFIQITAFFLITLITFLVIKPATKEIQQNVLNKRDQILDDIEELTGLKIAYESMSPLIMNSIELHEVTVESSGNISRAKIKKAVITLDIFNSLFKKGDDSTTLLSSVVFLDGDINLSINDLGFIEKLTNVGNPDALVKTKFSLKKVDLNLDLIDSEIILKDFKGSLVNIMSRYHLNFKSKVRFNHSLELPFTYVEGDANVKSLVLSSFEELSSTIKLSNIKSDIGDVKDLDLDLDLYDQEIIIKNREKKAKIDFLVKIKVAIEETFFSIKGQSFVIEDLFKPYDSFSLFDPFMDSTFTGDFKGIFNAENETFLFDSLGHLETTIPQLNIPADIDYHVVGDLDYLTVYSLNAKSNKGRVYFSGGVDLNNFFPQGRLKINSLALADTMVINSDINIKVINEKFININFNTLDLAGVELDNFPALVYIDDNDISLQALKRDASGKISLSGNYNISTGAITSKINVDNINPVIIKDIIPIKDIQENIENYRLTIKGDFTSKQSGFNYNINQLSMSDINENYLLYFTGRGSQKEFSIDDMLVNYGGVDLKGRVDGFFKDDTIDIKVDTLINENVYDWQIKIKAEEITAKGNYGLDLKYTLGSVSYLNLETKKMPISYKGLHVEPTISLKCAFPNSGSFLLSLTQFETVLRHESLSYSPTISFSADGTMNGLNVTNIIYRDNISPLVGNITFKLDGREIYKLNAKLTGNNNESYNISSEYDNKNNNLNVDLNLVDFALGRLQDRSIKGETNLKLRLNGNLEEFRGKGSLLSNNIVINDKSAKVKLDLSVSEKLLSLSKFDIQYSDNHLKAPLITYNVKNGRLLGKMELNSNVADLDMKSDLTLDFNVRPLKSILDFDSKALNSTIGKIIIGNFYVKDSLLFSKKTLRMYNSSSAFQLYSLDNKIRALYSHKTGLINIKIEKPYFASLSAKGYIKDNNIDLQLRDIDINAEFVSLLMPMTPIKDKRIIDFSSLNLKGQVGLKGDVDNPLINGLLYIDSIFDVAYIKEEIVPSRITLKIQDNEVEVLANKIRVGDIGLVYLDGDLILDSWGFQSIQLKAHIPSTGKIPVYYKYENIVSDLFLHSSGLSISLDETGANLDGRIVISDGEFYTDVTKAEVIESDNTSDVFSYFINLEVEIGANNKLYIPNKTLPILKATATPGEVIKIQYDSEDESFLVSGEASIIEGQIDYSGKPFILTEGKVVLNLSPENIDPYIKIIGSNSLIDESGRPVEIILTYEGSFFNDFKPGFSSIPEKSEDEILRLIGLTITGNDARDIFASADLLTDALIGKPLEDALKKLLGVDFVTFKSEALSSIITNISFDQESDPEYNERDNISKILNNTSLSLGNFITQDFYVTGSVGTTYQYERLGMNVQLGFELNTPHFLLGFNLNHNIEKAITQPEFGLSLSWVLNP